MFARKGEWAAIGFSYGGRRIELWQLSNGWWSTAPLFGLAFCVPFCSVCCCCYRVARRRVVYSLAQGHSSRCWQAISIASPPVTIAAFSLVLPHTHPFAFYGPAFDSSTAQGVVVMYELMEGLPLI